MKLTYVFLQIGEVVCMQVSMIVLENVPRMTCWPVVAVILRIVAVLGMRSEGVGVRMIMEIA